MHASEVTRWLGRSLRREQAVLSLHQPLTAMQLAHRRQWVLDAAGYILWELSLHDVVRVLNGQARRSRLYWLTDLGEECRARLLRLRGHPPSEVEFPVVDWDLYGWTCFRHRSAVIKAMTEPLQPADIKRRARGMDPELRISANNVRDVMRLLRERNIVAPIQTRGSVHPKYVLTDVGADLRRLLVGAEALS